MACAQSPRFPGESVAHRANGQLGHPRRSRLPSRKHERPGAPRTESNSSALSTASWQVVQSVIRFSSESSPGWLPSSLRWTSRLDIAPHDWHLQPSRRSTWSAEKVILLGIEPQACAFRSNTRHDASSVTWRRKVRLPSPGRNLKKRRADRKRTSGFSLSRFALAKKSAQIIFRQQPRDLSFPSLKVAVAISPARRPATGSCTA